MELLVERKYKKDKYTIGNFYIDDILFSNTLEDKDRDLTCSMSENQIKKIKVYGETAIPTGRYKVERTWSPKYGKKMIEIKNVPGFSGIRIHSGNYVDYAEFYKTIAIPKDKKLFNENEIIEIK